MAASFLLLFVESLADLGNPLLLGGNVACCRPKSTWRWPASSTSKRRRALVDAADPHADVFLVQRYYIGRRSYISVTGKPTTGRIFVKEPVTRWTFIILTLLTLALVLLLYFSILAGSFTKLWGIDNTLYLGNYATALTRGLNAILSTTFLSAVATPLAGLIGMIIAFLVVRRTFAGKQTLDFVSNLGGAVPGTILGIGYIIAFIQAPWYAVLLVYALLAAYLASRARPSRCCRCCWCWRPPCGYYFQLAALSAESDEDGWRYLMPSAFAAGVSGAAFAPPARRRVVFLLFAAMALALVIYNLSPTVTEPLARWGRTLPGVNWPKVVARLVTFHRPSSRAQRWRSWATPS
jgi:hypothetical protein